MKSGRKKDLETFALSLLKGITKTTEKAALDKRATAAYWNADNWGSISGVHDADDWMEGQVVAYIVKRLTKLSPKRRRGK